MESERLELHRLLVDDISKGLEQVKQQILSCSNKEQERGLQRRLSSYEEALSILTGRAPQEPCESVITSSSNPPPPSSNSASKVTESKGARRGIYERITWTTRVNELQDDRYAWRKFGQKCILNSKYPRNYFRCAYRNVQGCAAIKLVQQSSDNPKVYDITYRNKHTCKTEGETTKTVGTLINQQLHEKRRIEDEVQSVVSSWSPESEDLLDYNLQLI